MAGVIGAAVGIACATLAIFLQVRLRRRRGETVSFTQAALALPPAGVEREAVRRAAIWGFPVYVLVVTIAAAVESGGRASGFAMGAAGLVFGVSAAIASIRLGR